MFHRIDLQRVIRAGLLSFQRNSWLSTASIVMMTMVLLFVGSLGFLNAITQAVLASFSDKIDISVYVKANTPESQVLRAREEIAAFAEVKDVVYVSQDEALTRFKDAHKGNALILDSLDELDKNPLQASLNIKAKEAGQFEKVTEYLNGKNYSFVDKINFYENKAMIERLGAITVGARSGGILIAILFAAIAMIIAFNTIRVAIYSNRDEIQIMKLVGASHWYIRGPFIVEGILHGVISTFIALLLLFPAAWIFAPKIAALIPSFDLFRFYQDSALYFFIGFLFVGVGLGVFSSMIAMRRYLKEV